MNCTYSMYKLNKGYEELLNSYKSERLYESMKLAEKVSICCNHTPSRNYVIKQVTFSNKYNENNGN